MRHILTPALALSASLFAGAAAGFLSLPASHTPAPQGEGPESLTQFENTPPKIGPPTLNEEREGEEAVPNTSELARFGSFDFEKQKSILLSINLKFGKEIPPGMRIWIERVTKELAEDQAAALLEALPIVKDTLDPLRGILAARLAATDPQRALEMGKNLSDPQLVGSAIHAIAQKSGAEVIKAIDSLTPEQRGNLIFGGLTDGELKPAGTFEDFAKALKESPHFQAKGQLPGGWTLTRILASTLASEVLKDPSTALAQLRDLTEAADKNGRISQRGFPVLDRLIENTLSEIRTSNPVAASNFYDSLSEKERFPWLATDEAINRYKRGGIDSAVSFSEKQTSDLATNRAARGTWLQLAQQDKAAAIGWIDSLPQGPFRQGLLTGVLMDAWEQSKTWGTDDTAIQAAATLGSKAAQLDCLTILMTERLFGNDGGANSELISRLPISDSDKQELFRRVAPIKDK